MGQAGSPHPNAGALTAPTRRKTAKMGIAGLLVITAAGVALYGFVSLGWLRDDSKELHQKMTITGLATTGDISCVAVSPDGKYVAYGVKEKPHLSTLWVMQPATSARQEILPPSEAQYHALTFSPDGSYLYFVRVDPNIGRTLYRVPALGGVPKKLIESVDTAISFSPDGKQFVFRRSLNTRREAILAIANADGTGEKEVAAIAYPEYFGDPAWSPDGKVIACAAGHAGGGINMYVVTVSVGDWTVNQISPQRWRWVGQMDWLSDSSGVVMLATENPTAPIQIWRLSYPNGETRRITNDANDYNRMSMSADSRVLVALQSQQLSNVWVIPRDEAGGLRQITSGAGGYRTGLSWTADGKLIYDSEAGGATSISVMNADGRDPKLLLGDLTGLGIVGESRASPDGRYILYATDITGSRHIWRMNRDGSNPIQVTNGEREDNPSWSPDGRWVVFTSLETATSKRPTIWKAPIDGGDPVQIADAYTICPAVSPDGKLIACFYTESMTSRTMRIALYPFAGGQPVKVYDTPVHGWPYLRWTPDGLGLTYADNPAGPAKIWIQPVDGGPPKEFARFETDRVFGFDWSPDGTALACVRGMWAKDAVLIRDFN
jgi:Tol biopolymer transport system component